MANEGLPWLGEDKVLCDLLIRSFCPCGGCTRKDFRTMPQARLCPRGIWKYWGKLLVIMVLHCAQAGEGSWGWREVNMEQVLIKCQECSRRNEKKRNIWKKEDIIDSISEV